MRTMVLTLLLLVSPLLVFGDPTGPTSFSDPNLTNQDTSNSTAKPLSGSYSSPPSSPPSPSSPSLPSPSSPPPSAVVTSDEPTTSTTSSTASTSSSPTTTTTTTPTSSTTSSDQSGDGAKIKGTIFGIVLCVLVLVVAAGCIYNMWAKDSQGEGSEEERCLVGTRRRVRAAVGSLEQRLGVALWPRAKTEGDGGEDDDVEEGGGAGDQEEEEKDCDDSSQEDEEKEEKEEKVEGGPSKVEVEVERREEGEEEDDETSSESEDDQSGAGGGAEKVSLKETDGSGDQQGPGVFEVTVL